VTVPPIPQAASAVSAGSGRPRIAFLTYSTGLFDSRTHRMARSAVEAGYGVVIYARWEPGLPYREEVEGLPVVRAPADWRFAFPLSRGAARRRFLARQGAGSPSRAGSPRRGRLSSVLRGLARAPGFSIVAEPVRQLVLFAIRPYGWAVALEELVEPADVWHGMWAGSLPALVRFGARRGGRTIYDSRDIYLHARSFDRSPRLVRAGFRWLERRWARRVDAIITVNDAYAAILARTLGRQIAAVVRNCPPRYEPPSPPPDLIRRRLGLPPSTAVVLHQGNLQTDRGIEQGMSAILEVPGAALVLLGFGALHDELAEATRSDPWRDRVFLIDAVSPSQLLDWTASADLLLMAIQPTSLNHRYTTPNKLWEALAAGVPVVASDLPGMAEVVRETGAGVLCDPTSPVAIAAAIMNILSRSAAEREGLRRRALAAAHDRYNWEVQAGDLLALYRTLT
jgi:glycosyltransferase involved in cell wall biosynthesis